MGINNCKLINITKQNKLLSEHFKSDKICHTIVLAKIKSLLYQILKILRVI